MDIYRLAVATLSLALLVACGGGGGSGGGTPTTRTAILDLEPLPVYAVDVPTARFLTSGDRSLIPLSSSSIYQSIRSRAGSANVLQMSDIAVSVVTSTGVTSREPRAVTCFLTECTFTLAQGVPLSRFSLSNIGAYPLLSDTRLNGFNTDSQAVMLHNGVTMVQSRGAGRNNDEGDEARIDYHSYGGWLTNSFFAVESFAVTPEATGIPVVWYGAYSFGNNRGSNPSSGTATWNGVMVGTNEDGHSIHGEAEIDIDDWNNPDVDVAFTEIKNFDTRGDIDSMTWTDLHITGGRFNANDGSIEGEFYGNTHEEVGGIFDKDNIIGAFGAAR